MVVAVRKKTFYLGEGALENSHLIPPLPVSIALWKDPSPSGCSLDKRVSDGTYFPRQTSKGSLSHTAGQGVTSPENLAAAFSSWRSLT